jgi:hypothetical protein
MRRSPAAGAGRLPAKLLPALTLLASLWSCSPDAPIGPYGVRQVAIVLLSDTIRPGELYQATAFPLNRFGEIVDAPVTWQSMTPATLQVDAGGAIRALAPGVGIVRASVGSVTKDRTLQLVNPPAASIETSTNALTLVLPGGSAQLSATARDAGGAVLVGATALWTSLATRIATVTPSGLVTPVAVGNTTLRVFVDGIATDVAVSVAPAPSATAPTVVSVTPSIIGLGTVFTLRGSGFAPSGNGTAVMVDGRPAQTLSISDTLVTAILNAVGQPCLSSADVAVQLSTSGGVGAIGARLQLAPQRTLGIGESLLLTAATDLRCLELPGDGEYLVSVLNVARALGTGSVNVGLDAESGLGEPLGVTLNAAPATTQRIDAHLAVLEASRRATQSRTSPARTLAQLQVAPAGELTAVRVPDLDVANVCASYRQIHTRTVYAGSHVYILEDTTSRLGLTPLLTGEMDADIQEIGAEVDNILWPIITRFGDPLVMDSRLDDNDRVVIVLSPELNTMRAGAVLGAVVTCDFYARSQLAASNVGEMLYLQVPTLSGGADPELALARWKHAVRGTIAHELKHVVSFGEHIVRNLPLEEVWLEEATAQHAEELFTRALTGATATGNTEYATIRCEILAAQGNGSCAGTPALMKPTLDALWDFYEAPGARSPLGPTVAGDFSYYGSGWSLLRWAMDHAALPEATFTQQLTVSTQSGVENLEARAGRSWESMLARWSFALATDDRGVVPTDVTLRLPSWSLSSLFSGLCTDLGPCSGGLPNGSRFSRADPQKTLAPGGNFTLNVSDLAPASFVMLRVEPSGLGTRRLIRLRGPNGAPPPPTARLAILRVN